MFQRTGFDMHIITKFRVDQPELLNDIIYYVLELSMR